MPLAAPIPAPLPLAQQVDSGSWEVVSHGAGSASFSEGRALSRPLDVAVRPDFGGRHEGRPSG
jgi:hypothetical protein